LAARVASRARKPCGWAAALGRHDTRLPHLQRKIRAAAQAALMGNGQVVFGGSGCGRLLSTSKRSSPDIREPAVRRVLEHQGEQDSHWATIRWLGSKIAYLPETLRQWGPAGRVRPSEALRSTTAERDRLMDLEGLRQAYRSVRTVPEAPVDQDRGMPFAPVDAILVGAS
jgi:transposase